MIVHKFGGSSLASAEKIKNVSNIISCVDEAVVVSASAKTTSNLQKAIDQAIESQDYSETLNFIFEHHSSILEELVPSDDLLQQSILEDLKNIKHILSTIAITGFCADSLRFFILGFGEIWSAKILTLYLQSKGKKSYFIDASQCLIVNDRSYPVTVDWQKKFGAT